MTSNTPLLDQVKSEIGQSLKPVFKEKPELRAVFENICEPEYVHRWKAIWEDDKGVRHVNRCWRVQQSSAIGPYKGGLRFDESVTLDVLSFLALEQVFKNALTGKQIGGGKGGSDFNPRGRSDREIRNFCKAFMMGLHKVIGPETDVPAGDIGVNSKVIGYLFGAWKQLGNPHNGALSGKSVLLSGSDLRTEATGYGVIYLLNEHLKAVKDADGLKGKTVVVSGSGNVATYCAIKAIEMGATVVTLSDRKGTYFCADGLTVDDVHAILAFKKKKGKLPSKVIQANKNAWVTASEKLKGKLNIAIPCATQNEIKKADAKLLIEAGVKIVIEGSNLSSTEDAVEVYKEHSKTVDYIGSKLANLGGVGTSYLEMMQNSSKAHWTREKVDEELHQIMTSAYAMAKTAATKYGVSLTDGANIAAFLKVAEAMQQLGFA